jgi:DNA polymerase V
LRHQESVCTGVYVYIATALFSEDRYFKGDLQKLVMPTANTSTIISNAHNIIDNIYVEGKKYAKAGVVLTGIINKTNIHSDLFEVSYQTGSQEKLMSVIDGLNNKMGKGAVSFACNGIDKQWKMSQKLLSNEYTTIWDQLAIVKA